MPTRLHLPPLLDVVVVDDPGEMEWLDREPAISRDISKSGGWVHRLLHARIHRTLTVGAEPLPVFSAREDGERAVRQDKLEFQLSAPGVAPPLDREALRTLGRHVAGADLGDSVGVAVQQLVGRLFSGGYTATPESYAAAKLLFAWLTVDPVRALWWRWSGQLAQSRRLLWRMAGDDPQCIHATTLAIHNIVESLDRMRALLKDPRRRDRLTPAQAAEASLVAPGILLRSCTRPTRVPFLKAPLQPGTLILFRLAKMHRATADVGLAFARGHWNQCPAHDIVPRVLGEVWIAARQEWAQLRYTQHTLSPAWRLAARGAAALNHVVPWHRLPRWLGLVNVGIIRRVLRARNLHSTSSPTVRGTGCPMARAPGFRTERTADGSYNDLADPAMGSAGTGFGRNVPLAFTRVEPEPALLQPNPRLISRRLMTRETFIPARALNVLAAAWIQFEVHDWFSHGNDPKRPFEVEIEPDDDWEGQRPMRIARTPAQFAPERPQAIPSFVNEVTHWWDASQLYGSNVQTQHRVRARQDGKLRVRSDGRLPFDERTGIETTGVDGNWWVGLSLMHALFTLEHNAICDRLRTEHPGWDDEQLFATARLINAALIAKIHTLEWTTAILNQPAVTLGMSASWWGLVGEHLRRLFGRAGESDLLWGIVGSTADHHSAAYAMTEEFVAVYRMHPLMPDHYTFLSARDGSLLQTRDLAGVSGHRTRSLLDQVSMTDLFYSLGIAHPGAITLHNYPKGLRELKRPDGSLLDLAAVDVLRDRERGLPRYNAFRELLHLPPVRTFEELSPRWAAELREVYQHVDRVDLMVGLFAETPPEGFGFSDTAFRIFILMAGRRLKSDRFFTTDYTPAVYTQTGLDWIANTDMKRVLLRHYPALAPMIQHVPNVFAPWDRVTGLT